MSTFLVALTVAIPTLLATSVVPILLSRQNARQAAIQQKENWKREDEVAARAAAAAKGITDLQNATAQRLDTANVVVKEKLVEIHTLVNSDMTAARQAELNQTTLVLATLRRVVALDVAADREPDPDDVRAIKLAEDRIAELQEILVERAKQQELVEAQQAEAEAKT